MGGRWCPAVASRSAGEGPSTILACAGAEGGVPARAAFPSPTYGREAATTPCQGGATTLAIATTTCRRPTRLAGVTLSRQRARPRQKAVADSPSRASACPTGRGGRPSTSCPAWAVGHGAGSLGRPTASVSGCRGRPARPIGRGRRVATTRASSAGLCRVSAP